MKWGEILLSHSVKINKKKLWGRKKKFVDLVGLKMIDDLVFLTFYEMRKFEKEKEFIYVGKRILNVN